MTMVKSEPISFQHAFGLLMEHSFAKQAVKNATAVQLNAHPFGLDVINRVPEWLYEVRNIYYIGNPGYTDCSVSGMLRVIGQHLGEWAAWSHNVWHLRRILCGDHTGHDVYFEIAISDNLYICGGCTDCSGAGGAGKDTMDGVFACLSQMYGLQVETVEIPIEESNPQDYVRDFIQREGVLEKLEEPKPGVHTFAAGQRVHLSDYANNYAFFKSRQANQEYIVEDTERIFFRCTCGFGEKIPVVLHPERCSLRERSEQMHHQFLYIRIDGDLRRLSGIFFEPS